MNCVILLLATGFGAGYSPLVPGTAGTLAAIPVYLVFSSIPSPISQWTVVAFFFLSCWVSDKAQTYWGTKDDRRIVIDEIMGYLVAMMWLPRTTQYVVIGFFLFRFFDILKPPPLRRLERLRGGFGVVLDDVGAGIYANITLHIIRLFFGW